MRTFVSAEKENSAFALC
jgi:hypothetical protein